MRRISSLATITSILLLSLVLAAPSQADPVKCQREILKRSGKFTQAKMKALQKCGEKLLVGKLKDLAGTPIVDPGPGGGARRAICAADLSTMGKIDRAQSKLVASIDKRCGGIDRDCTTAGDNDPLSAIGWGSICPGFEIFACDNPITHCGDIGTCLGCIQNAAVDQAFDLYYDALVTGATGDELTCQRKIGKETAKYFLTKSKALQKCEDKVLKGKLASCPDSKTTNKILRAEVKKVAQICKACGGANGVCELSGDDLTLASVGFVASCPDVTAPGGASCGATVTEMQHLVDCVDCVSDFKTECLDAVAVSPVPDPNSADPAYPAECKKPIVCPGGGCDCTDDIQCQTGHCVDGKCCDTACDGVCEACNIAGNEGTCSPEPAGTVDPGCGGTCTGFGGCCTPLIDSSGDGVNSLDHATGITLDDSGQVYVAGTLSNNVFRISLGTCTGGTNNGEPCSDVAFCPDTGAGTSCAGGSITQILGSTCDGTSFPGPADIAVDSVADHVYLVSHPPLPGGASGCMLTPSGELLFIDPDGDMRGQTFNNSNAVALGDTGKVYPTADGGNAFQVVLGTCSGGTNGGEPCSHVSFCPDPGGTCAGGEINALTEIMDDDLRGVAVDQFENVYLAHGDQNLALKIVLGTCTGGSNNGEDCSDVQFCPDPGGSCVGGLINTIMDAAVGLTAPTFVDVHRASGRVYVAGSGGAFEITLGTCQGGSQAGEECSDDQFCPAGSCDGGAILKIVDGVTCPTGLVVSQSCGTIYASGECSNTGFQIVMGTCTGGGNAGERCSLLSHCPEQGAGTACTGTVSQVFDGTCVQGPRFLALDEAGNLYAAGVTSDNAVRIERPQAPNASANGASCVTCAECASGICVDGTCCDGACDDTCEACNLAGSEGACTFIPAATDPDGECTVLGEGCNGRGACQCYRDNGDGTITDLCLGLMWQQSTNLDVPGGDGGVVCPASPASSPCDDPTDADNRYEWSTPATLSPPDGSLFTNFVVKLNGYCDGDWTTPCAVDSDCPSPPNLCGLAGHQDWRVPSVGYEGAAVELETIVDLTIPGCPGPGLLPTEPPCIDPIFDPTLISIVPCTFCSYWSSETVTANGRAYTVDFRTGGPNMGEVKHAHESRVRGVRGPVPTPTP